MQRVEAPIFIVGTGRSGSTIFHKLLSYHPHTAWFTRFSDAFPTKPQYSRLAMYIFDLPLPRRYVRKLIYPLEGFAYWEHYCSGFSEPCRDLCKEDVTLAKKKTVQKAMAAILTKKRTRLIFKNGGWPRVGFLKEIFPDAKFIHIHRDGRAVVNSLLHVDWWSGWRGPDNWRMGELTPEQRQKWKKYDKSFVALCAIGLEILMEAMEKIKPTIPPEDWMELCYEDLCQNTLETLSAVIEFCELEWTPNYEAMVSQIEVKSANYKWREQLTEAQQRILNECLQDSLKKYGYV